MFAGGYRSDPRGADVRAAVVQEGYDTICTAPLLDGPEETPYDADIFVAYTRHIIEQMGGRGATVDACGRRRPWTAARLSSSHCLA